MKGFAVLAALAVWLVCPVPAHAQCLGEQCLASAGHPASRPVVAAGQAVFRGTQVATAPLRAVCHVKQTGLFHRRHERRHRC